MDKSNSWGPERVYDEVGNVIETTPGYCLVLCAAISWHFADENVKNDRALAVAMCAQSVCLLFRA